MRILRLAALAGLAAAVARKLVARRSSDALEGAGGGPSGAAVASPPVSAPEGGMSAGTRAPAPADAPGPSVNPGAQPELDAEEPVVEGIQGDNTQTRSMEDIVAEEEAAAAAEAGAIGGEMPRDELDMDPEMRPVYEAGGGDAEGFEQAEEMLIRNATHDEGGGKPLEDAFTPEAEADRSTAEYGEADGVHATAQQDDDEGRASGTPSDAA